jgi:hypothetical protein
MAKSKSAIFKFQGSIENLTYVNSKAYKPHVRRRKGTVTPVVLTGEMKENVTRLPQCNEQAKLVFHALRDERHDGALWSRIIKLFFNELKVNGKVSVNCLLGLDCNLPHIMENVIASNYDFEVTKNKKKLVISAHLPKHPIYTDQIPRIGYHLRFVVIFPDFAKHKFRKEVVESPAVSYNTAPEAVQLEVAMPSAKTPYVVLMGMMPLVQGGERLIIQSDAFLKVLAVG